MKRTRLGPQFKSIQTQVSSCGCRGASVESRENEAMPLDCRRRRKESLIDGLRGEQAFEVPKNHSETPYVVSYNGLRRTLWLVPSKGPSPVKSGISAPPLCGHEVPLLTELETGIIAPRCYKYVAPDGAFALGACPAGDVRQQPGVSRPCLYPHLFTGYVSSPSGRATEFPKRQHPRGTAGLLETPTASFIPAQGNALGLSAKDHSER